MGFSHARVIIQYSIIKIPTGGLYFEIIPTGGLYFDFIPTGGSRFLASNKLYVFEGTRIECGSLWRRTAPYGVTHLFNYPDWGCISL